MDRSDTGVGISGTANTDSHAASSVKVGQIGVREQCSVFFCILHLSFIQRARISLVYIPHSSVILPMLVHCSYFQLPHDLHDGSIASSVDLSAIMVAVMADRCGLLARCRVGMIVHYSPQSRLTSADLFLPMIDRCT